jgi:hypothetical protein
MPRVAFEEREQFIISLGTDAGESRSRVGAVADGDRPSEERLNARFVSCAGKSPSRLGGRMPPWQRLWPGRQSGVHWSAGRDV